MNGVLILSKRLKTVYPPFDDKGFKLFIESRLGELSFNERSYLISEAIEKFLPDDFESTAQILLDSLPEPRSTELKELGAFEIATNNKFKSRQQVIRDMGGDPATVDAQIEADPLIDLLPNSQPGAGAQNADTNQPDTADVALQEAA